MVASHGLAQLLEEFLDALPLPPMLFRILRVLRVLRLVRLIKGSRGTQDLIMTLVISAPALLNVVTLLLLISFMYGVLGVDLFTFVHNPSTGQLDDLRNFDDLASTALVLFQCLTNDDWSIIMTDLMITPRRGCHPDAELNDCGSRVLPVVYFFTFIVIAQFVLLNIVIAVLVYVASQHAWPCLPFLAPKLL